MAKGHKVVVTINADATVAIAVDGHKGKGCEKLTEDLEKLLGKRVKNKRTSEYHEKPQRTRVQQ